MCHNVKETTPCGLHWHVPFIEVLSETRLFHMHTKLAIMTLMPTLYSHTFAVFSIIYIFRC